jgi:hypothetical protein
LSTRCFLHLWVHSRTLSLQVLESRFLNEDHQAYLFCSISWMILLLFFCDLPSGWDLFYKLEAGALFILPNGVNGRFSDSNQALHSLLKKFFKWFINQTWSGWSWLVIPPGITTKPQFFLFNFCSSRKCPWKTARTDILGGLHEDPGHLSPNIFHWILHQVMCSTSPPMHNNIFREHHILRYHFVTENKIRW